MGDVLDGQLPFHRVLAEWFGQKFGQPTDVQSRAWPLIAAGHHTLISAPTGSGKTLAALLPPLDRVIRAKTGGEREASGSGVRILYVTPLKALNNDIRRHLFDFREEWTKVAQTLGEPWPELSVGVRTGDTSQSTRASMLRKPPDVLVTTPESLYMLLTSHKARETLRTVHTVVVDEIHDLAAGDRGMHLSLSLERLSVLCGRTPQRIGVSATQNPPERIARFLGGYEISAGTDGWEGSGGSDGSADSDGLGGTGGPSGHGGQVGPDGAGGSGVYGSPDSSGGSDGSGDPAGVVSREVMLVKSRMERELDIQVTVPAYGMLLRNRREDIWTPLIEEILRHIGDGGTTLIFVGNRRLCERLSARLNEAVGEGFCRSHHGSVSREQRLETEQLLREGKLRCLVATSSLELGIDIGDIDHVLQIDTPYTAASGIQRFGRSGHSVGGKSRGTIIVRIRGQLPEVAVLAGRIARRETEAIEPPSGSLAVLAQQVVAMVAVEDWQPDALYRLVRSSDAYHDLPRERFDEMLDMLSGLYPFVRPLIDWDRKKDRLTHRPVTAMAAITGSGTIPSSSNYPVYHAETRVHLGDLDEEFVFESRVGDTFQLGASNWRIRTIRPDRVEVTESGAALGEIPFWRAEGQGRSLELSLEIGRLMEKLEQMLSGAGEDGDGESGNETSAVDWLVRNHHFSSEAAGSLIGLIKAQNAFSAWPTHRRIVIEWYADDSGMTHVVIHSWFGRKINRTWQMAIERLLEKFYPLEFQSTVKDNGIELLFRVWDPALLDRILSGVNPETLESLIVEALPGSPMFAARFRQLAETSLLLSRSFRRLPSWLKRLRGQELLRDAMPVAARFPLVKETMRDCMERQLDVPGLLSVLRDMERGGIGRVVAKCDRPSPLSMQFFFDYLNIAVYESDALTRDLRQGMLRISRELAEEVFGKDGLDEEPGPVRIADIFAEAFQEESRKLEERFGQAPESADGLWQLMKERGDLDEAEIGRLMDQGQKVRTWFEGLLSSGRIVEVTVAGERRFVCGDEQEIYGHFPESPHAMAFVLGRFVETRPEFGAGDLMLRYGLSPEEAAGFIEEWSRQGRIVPSPVAKAWGGEGQPSPSERRWISVRLQERLERHVARSNRSNQVGKERLIRLLQNVHHLEPERKLAGPEGVMQVLEQLQGLFLPVSWWESVVLPARVADYRREDLDLLCATGEFFWLGRRDEGAKEGKIAFFRADRPDLFGPFLPKEEDQPLHPELYGRLRERGASFLTSLASDTGEAPSQLTSRLMDMVWQGLVANDQFSPLRLHGQKREPQGRTKFRSGLGRWYAVSDLREGRGGTGREVREDAMERAVLAWTRHLMQMFGILTRAVVQAYSPFTWETHLVALSSMEDLGLAVRGLFVRDIPALQFSGRETVEWLRGMQQDREDGANGCELRPEHTVMLSAADPANPFGLVLDWPEGTGTTARFARKPNNYLLLDRGRWLCWAENNSRKLTAIDPSALDPALQTACIKTAARCLIREHGQRKVVIEQINGVPASSALGQDELARTGAERDGHAIVIWPSGL